MSSSSDDDSSEDEMTKLFAKAEQQSNVKQHNNKRRLSSSSSSPPSAMAQIGGAAGAEDTKGSDNDDGSSESDEDDDSPRKRRKNKKKNDIAERLARLEHKRAMQERQLKMAACSKSKRDSLDSDDDSDDDDDDNALSSKTLTKNIDKGRISISVMKTTYDEDGNEENTTTIANAASDTAAAAKESSSQPETVELLDSSDDDDEKPAAKPMASSRRRHTRANPAPHSAAAIAAAAQGSGVNAQTLIQAQAALHALQCAELDRSDNDDDDIEVLGQLPSPSRTRLNAAPKLLMLKVEATLEDVTGEAEPPKMMTISMLSSESFRGLVENLLEQLSLPKTSSTTLQFQGKVLRVSQTPDSFNSIKCNNDTTMESGSLVHARIYGVSSKSTVPAAKLKRGATSSAQTAANLGPSLRLTLRSSKDGQKEEMKHRQKEPFQALVNAYRTKKSIPPTSSITLQFDGQNLRMNQTPLQCDMEDEDMIDVQIK